RAQIADEDRRLAALQEPEDFDRWGGYRKAGWREQPTGFYRAARRDGFWWLITPEGNPCFYVGVDLCPATTWETTPITGREELYEWLPPREQPWAAAWSRNQWGINDGTEYVCFYTCNLIRKYGAEKWADEALARCIRRLKAFGFSGGGKWGAPREMPQAPVLWAWNTPKLAGHPDVFDADVCAAFEKDLRRQIEPRLDDPSIVGWSFGNEISEVIKRDEVRKILSMSADVPAKRALVDYALREIYAGSIENISKAWSVNARSAAELYNAAPTVPDADVERLRLFYEDRYWSFVYETVKRIDPNHLFMSVWLVPGWWESEDDWRVAARHCDVLGYDRYALEFADDRLRRLLREADKPALCGEFSFPAWYDGWRGFGRYPVAAKDDAEAGDLYYRWVHDAARNPYCVGVMWFQYRDQPITGRGPGKGLSAAIGEHYAFGIITETDQVKWDLALRMRKANLQAAAWRLEAMAQNR
ncbi:MAG: glycosyl hydrolase, partial [Armatimonadetes bacterium]|nr:glycosyl hydrolase [Armatimonadota bacterium]